MEDKLTLLEAYKSMRSFLNDYYFRFNINDLSEILSETDLLPDGGSADPAAWFDWLEAVKRVLEEEQK
jgi:hypothetical protein